MSVTHLNMARLVIIHHNEYLRSSCAEHTMVKTFWITIDGHKASRIHHSA